MDYRPIRCVADAQRRRDCLRHKMRLGQIGDGGKPHPLVEKLREPLTECQREARLADTARAGQREQACFAQQRLE
jgi:hypothetical protein